MTSLNKNMKTFQMIAFLAAIVLVGCGRSGSETAKGDTGTNAATNATSNTQATISLPKEPSPASSNAPPLPASPATGSGATATWSPPAVEVYREVTQEDGIRYYERLQSEVFRNGRSSAVGFECGVVGADGKRVGIELLSTTVDDGEIQTKDFGILKREAGNNFTVKLFATESQIAKLREFQSSPR